MTLQTTLIPRTALKATLPGLRIPISGIEVLTGQRGNDNWPPALAFEDFEAGAKKFVGLVLGDGELVDEGRTQQAKVTELRRAVELDAQADQARATADSTLKATRNRAEDERREAELKAREREDAIHRDLRAAQQHANRDLDKKAAVVDRAARTSDKRVAATQRQAALTRVNQQSAATTPGGCGHPHRQGTRSTPRSEGATQVQVTMPPIAVIGTSRLRRPVPRDRTTIQEAPNARCHQVARS